MTKQKIKLRNIEAAKDFVRAASIAILTSMFTSIRVVLDAKIHLRYFKYRSQKSDYG